MQELSYRDLSQEERDVVNVAFDVAEHSFSKSGNKVGAVITCENGMSCKGAAVEHSRVVKAILEELLPSGQGYYLDASNHNNYEHI